MAMRMRTKMLLALLSVSLGLSAISLIIIRSSLEQQIRKQIRADLEHSVLTFQYLENQRNAMLAREAALLADLPSLKALMTTSDRRTIEDGSGEFWRVSGTDLFALADRSGELVAIYQNGHSLPATDEDKARVESLLREPPGSHLLFLRGRLYEAASAPLYFGSSATGSRLGDVVIGYAIDDRVISAVRQTAAADVMFLAMGQVAATTLDASHQQAAVAAGLPRRGDDVPREDVWLGREHYLATSIPLSQPGSTEVRLLVLKSYDEASRFLSQLNRLIAILGLVVLFGGGAVALYLSRTITGPLEQLAAGARALGEGDFNYAHKREGAREIRELSDTFDSMRERLRKSQQDLLEAERLATIGRMASSISHDLRHALSAVYANAEFLEHPNLRPEERIELLSEVRQAVQGMTELIDSLLLFSRTGRALQPTYAQLHAIAERAIASLQKHPEAQSVRITLTGPPLECYVDARKVERALYNLLLNACQSAKHSNVDPQVHLGVGEDGEMLLARVEDNGSGVPEAIRSMLFEPFVSSGKANGIGLGLTLAHRIAQEHGGEVILERSTADGSVFVLRMSKARLRELVDRTLTVNEVSVRQET